VKSGGGKGDGEGVKEERGERVPGKEVRDGGEVKERGVGGVGEGESRCIREVGSSCAYETL
jgi:hypothetical protein